MILGFTGNRFLAEEKAREVLLARGLHLRELPRLAGDEVSVEAVAPFLMPGLFGDAAVLLDFEGAKPGKDLLGALEKAPALVAVLDPDAPATRIKLYEKVGEHHPSPTPARAGDIAGWVAQRARGAGLKLDRDAALYLAEVFGPDLASIAGELNKLTLLDAAPLTRDAVMRVVGREPPGDSFAMLGAATGGKPAEALGQLRRLLAGGEDPFRMMGAVVWQYSLVARCVALLQEGGPVNENVAAQRLGVKPYPAKKALEVARRLNEAKIRAHLGRTLEADLAMKSGQEPGMVLERLIVSLSL